jgi:predicted permease
MNLAGANFDDLLAQNHTFAAMAKFTAWPSAVSGGSEPVRANIARVSASFFKVLAVDPIRGRLFTADELRPHGTPAVVVSHAYWQRYLGSQTDLSTLHLTSEGSVYNIIGVMPAGFDFPGDVSAWAPAELDPPIPSRTAHNWRGMGRLRDGATLAQAQSDLGSIASRLRATYGNKVDLNGAIVIPLSAAIVGDVRTPLLTLLAAVGLLLLVACANVAGLLLARTSARRPEFAVRAALGAGRARLLQQFLVESSVLALFGGLLGIVIAFAAVKVLPAILPTDLASTVPGQQGIALNTPVLLFALAAILAVALALGLFTAARAGAEDLLTAGARSNTSRQGHRLRSALVIGEIATTLVILVAAGLLGRSFLTLVQTSPGFDRQSLVTMEFLPPVQSSLVAALADPEAKARQAIALQTQQIQQLDSLIARLRALPGVHSVGLVGALPVAAGDNLSNGTFLVLNGQPTPTSYAAWDTLGHNPATSGNALFAVAGEDYFRTLGVPLLRGRMFAAPDNPDSTHVAVISQALAQQRWPGEDPIGQIIEFGNMDGNLKPLTIVGVVGDIRARGLDLPPSPIVYVNYRQRGMGSNAPTIVVRSDAPAGEIITPARAIFHQLAPDTPVKFSTFAAELGVWFAARRFLLVLVALFAISALALAAVGIYGVVAFSVTRRTQEIGIRMALGARRADVLLMVLREGARMAACGVVAGIAFSLALTRLLSSMLFGVTPTDPITFTAVALLLALVALLASYIPARRATQVDPLTALRYE